MNFKQILRLNSKTRFYFWCGASRSEYANTTIRRAYKAKSISVWAGYNPHIRSFEKFQYFSATRSSHTSSNEQVAKKNEGIELQPVQFDDVSFEQPVSHEYLVTALRKCSSIEDQMNTLCETLKLSDEDIQKRINFCKTIESMIRPFFPDFNIQMFGSTVNGFGFKGCDIDMSFCTSPVQKPKIYYIERPDIPLVGELLNGKVSLMDIAALPEKEQLLFIHTIFLELYNESAVPANFIDAHVPIIRFYHDKYNLKCDLTCRNYVAFANTKLLYLFGKLDKRVIPLMMFLRYWAKHVELIGKGLMFNTYTISLLVIYYLQTCNPPVLPTAELILSLTDGLQIQDMSDHSFLNVIESIPPSQNTQTLEQLLRDFFFYYMYFDFTRVVCPLTATAVSKEDFFSHVDHKKFRNNTMCVQDPILCTHNVAELVDYKHCKQFFLEMMTPCKMYQDTNNLLNADSNNWGLLALLDQPRESSFKKNTNFLKLVAFDVPTISKQLRNKCSTLDNNKLLITAQTVLDILEYVLLFECKTLKYDEVFDILRKFDSMSAKQKKVMETAYKNFCSENRKQSPKFEQTFSKYERQLLKIETNSSEIFQNFNTKNKLISCVECKVSQNVWQGRVNLRTDNFSSEVLADILEKERLISLQVAKQNREKNEEKTSTPFRFLCECYSTNENTSVAMHINFRPLQKLSFNPILGIFLQEFIPKILMSAENGYS